MRGSFLALAVGVAFLIFTAVLSGQFYCDLPPATDYRFLGPILFALIGAGLLIALFLWLRRKR